MVRLRRGTRAADAGDVAKRAALGLGILFVCGLIAIGGAWAAAAGGETVVAIIVICAGVAILARRVHPAGPLADPPGGGARAAAGTVSAAGLDLHGGVGDRDYRPATAAELDDEYQLGVGQLVVDLRQTDLPRGDVPLKVDLGIGEARVLVPKNVCVATDAQVGIGEVRTFDRHSGGVDVDVQDRPDAPPARTRLLLDANVGIGAAADRALERRPGLRATRTSTSAPSRPASSTRIPAVSRSADLTSLVAGVAVVALGVLLLLDAGGTLDLRFGVLGAGRLRGARGDPARVGPEPPAMIPV